MADAQVFFPRLWVTCAHVGNGNGGSWACTPPWACITARATMNALIPSIPQGNSQSLVGRVVAFWCGHQQRGSRDPGAEVHMEAPALPIFSCYPSVFYVRSISQRLFLRLHVLVFAISSSGCFSRWSFRPHPDSFIFTMASFQVRKFRMMGLSSKSSGVHGIHIPRGAAARFRAARVHPFPLGSFSK